MPLALITGASKGIGNAIAIELAKRKTDVLLVARSNDLLGQTSEWLSKTYEIKTDYLALDLTIPGAAQQVVDWCKEKNYSPDILVNNAGYAISGPFLSHTLEEELKVMTINMQVVAELCHLLLPGLLQQPRSYILNISSQAAFQSVPALNVYAASKAFVLSFSRGLRFELKKTNVSVTVVCPGSTDTHFAKEARVGAKALKAAKRFNMPAAAVARIAVNAMFRRKAEVTTGFINKMGQFLVWLLPASWSEKTAAAIYEL